MRGVKTPGCRGGNAEQAVELHPLLGAQVLQPLHDNNSFIYQATDLNLFCMLFSACSLTFLAAHLQAEGPVLLTSARLEKVSQSLSSSLEGVTMPLAAHIASNSCFPLHRRCDLVLGRWSMEAHRGYGWEKQSPLQKNVLSCCIALFPWSLARRRTPAFARASPSSSETSFILKF